MTDDCACYTTHPATNRDIVGIELRGVYDGMLYWYCVACSRAFQRFDDPDMQALAQPYIDEENAKSDSALKATFQEINGELA